MYLSQFCTKKPYKFDQQILHRFYRRAPYALAWVRIKKTVVEREFWTKHNLFTRDLEPKLRTHKLSTKLKDLWSFPVEYNTSVDFYFTSKNP